MNILTSSNRSKDKGKKYNGRFYARSIILNFEFMIINKT
jgi:hypothetical protein